MTPILWSTDVNGFIHVQSSTVVDAVETLTENVLPKPSVIDSVRRRWEPTAREKARKYGLNYIHVLTFIGVESQGYEHAESRDGLAWGLMQVRPSSSGVPYTRDELMNPVTNIDVGCQIMRSFWNRLLGPDLPSLASAYNGGIRVYISGGKLIDTRRPWPDSTSRWGMREERGSDGVGHIDRCAWTNNYLLGLSRPAEIIVAAREL